MNKKVEIVRRSTSEANVSKRHVWFDVMVNGELDATFTDVVDAVARRDALRAKGPETYEVFGRDGRKIRVSIPTDEE